MVKSGDPSCSTKHIAVIGVIVGTVLLVCSGLWAWTGNQLAGHDERIGRIERELAGLSAEIRIQYESLRRDVTEIKTDVKEIVRRDSARKGV